MAQLTIDTMQRAQLRALCARWRISRLELFGSALRDDFRSDSDIDLLVSFAADADWSLLEHAQMQQELSDILHRPVDLISRRAVERSANHVRRRAILDSAREFIAAGS